MIARASMVLSAAVILALGIVHLIYTFRGPKLTPRDSALQARMREVSEDGRSLCRSGGEGDLQAR